MIDFWLIRHGETEENVAGICQGQTPGTLSKKGILQAEAAGEALKTEVIDTFYSSDLRRTILSMEAIAKHHPGQEIIPEILLRERYLASWQGKPFPKNWKQIGLPAGSETVEDLMRRATAFIEKLKSENAGQKVAAMSHGGMVRAFWTVLNGKTADEYYDWETPKNTSISRFQIHTDGTVKTLLFNDAEHLQHGQLESNNRSVW